MDKGPIDGWRVGGEFVVMQVYKADLGDENKQELWSITKRSD